MVLVGDAAACPSLLAGQGSALAMVEAYVLAVELARANGDHTTAFARYHARLAPLLRSKQDAAKGLGLAFAPRGRVQLAVRNTMMRLLGLPRIPDLVMAAACVTMSSCPRCRSPGAGRGHSFRPQPAAPTCGAKCAVAPFAGEIERTQEILGQVLGQEPRLVRMPWLWRQPAILSMLGRSGLTRVSGLVFTRSRCSRSTRQGSPREPWQRSSRAR